MQFNLDSFLRDVDDYCCHHNISTAELSRQIGVSRTYLSLVRNGKKTPSFMLVKSILNIMRKSEHDYRII